MTKESRGRGCHELSGCQKEAFKMKAPIFNFKNLIIILCAVLVAACGKKVSMSREQAAGVIAKNLNLPEIKMTNLGKRFLVKSWSEPSPMPALCNVSGKYGDPMDASTKERLDELQSKGLVSLGKDRIRDHECNFLYTTATLTPDGKKYLVKETAVGYEVKAYELAFGEVTGIQINEQMKAAQADYTLKKINITPFGNNISVAPISGQAAFSLYDDGWRMRN